MPPSDGQLKKLDPLQQKLLVALTDLEPAPRLTGGAALIAGYLGHRSTRDLDLFWRERETLGDLPNRVLDCFRAAGITDLRFVTRTPSFVRVQVRHGQAQTLVDLVAEPLTPVAPGQRLELPGGSVWMDSAQEILTNKLVALLSRTELRDLQDAAALVDAGLDLDAALNAAPTRDAGFSAMMLAWVLKQAPFTVLARRAGLPEATLLRLEAFKTELLTTLAERGPSTT